MRAMLRRFMRRCPIGAKHTRPGQRPGEHNINPSPRALQGRHNRGVCQCGAVQHSQAAGLGFHVAAPVGQKTGGQRLARAGSQSGPAGGICQIVACVVRKEVQCLIPQSSQVAASDKSRVFRLSCCGRCRVVQWKPTPVRHATCWRMPRSGPGERNCRGPKRVLSFGAGGNRHETSSTRRAWRLNPVLAGGGGANVLDAARRLGTGLDGEPQLSGRATASLHLLLGAGHGSSVDAHRASVLVRAAKQRLGKRELNPLAEPDPRGLVAALNFAPNRGSDESTPDKYCHPPVDALGQDGLLTYAPFAAVPPQIWQ
jgi:hypothetical protein